MTTETKERSIIFTAEEVRASLDGRKTQFRRVIRNQPTGGEGGVWMQRTGRNKWRTNEALETDTDVKTGVVVATREFVRPVAEWLMDRCPYAVGDRLWVKETWWEDERTRHESPREVIFDATPKFARDHRRQYVRCTCPDGYVPSREECRRSVEANRFWHRRSAVHMPRWASRLTLEVTDVRVQRLQEITEDDCVAEGCDGSRVWAGASLCDPQGDLVINQFWARWDETAKKGEDWISNPWVWAVTFRKCEGGAHDD